MNPAILTLDNTLRTKNNSVRNAVKLSQYALDFFFSIGVDSFLAPTGEYFIGVMVVMVVIVATAVAMVIVMMMLVIVATAFAMVIVVVMVVIVATAFAMVIVVMMVVVVTTTFTMVIVMMMLVIVATALAMLIVVMMVVIVAIALAMLTVVMGMLVLKLLHIRLQCVNVFNYRKDCLAVNFVPIGCDNLCIFIMLANQLYRTVELVLGKGCGVT